MAEQNKFTPCQEIGIRFIQELMNKKSNLLTSSPNVVIPAPINATGKTFSGINRLLLSQGNLTDPRWFTKKQAKDAGYFLNEKALSRKVIFWDFKEEKPVRDNEGQFVLDDKGHVVTKTVERERPAMSFYTLYHANELMNSDGQSLPAYNASAEKDFDINRLQTMLESSGVKIAHDQKQSRTFYRGNDDSFHLMPENAYPNKQAYAADILTGLVRASRSRDRLNRPCGPHGTEGYAKEELRVAISSLMLAQDLNLPFNSGQNESFVKSWAEIIKKDPYELARACRDAEQIKEYIMGLEHKQKREINAENIVDREEALELLNDIQLAIEEPSVVELMRIVEGMDDTHPNLAAHNYFKAVVHDMKEIGGEIAASGLNDDHPDLEGQWQAIGKMVDDFEKIYLLPPSVQNERVNEPLTQPEVVQEKVYLNVPFKEKDEAKSVGAKWDGNYKLWYAPAGTAVDCINKWIPEIAPVPTQNMSPAEEFAQTLERAGLRLDGPPVMDGTIHRVKVDGGKTGSLDGAYCGYLNDRPNGWFQNHKTGEKAKWLATGQVLTETQKNAIKQEAQGNQVRREAERAALQAEAVEKAADYFNRSHDDLRLLPDNYLERKGVFNHHRENELSDYLLSNIRCDFAENENWGNILIPGYDKDGNLQTVQTIGLDGQKMFAKGCPKAGAMHIIDPHVKMIDEWVPELEQAIVEPKTIFPTKLSEVSNHNKILIAEGYATGASLHLATKLPVVVAFDAGNLKAVASSIRENFPDAEITICADNDHKNDNNIGREKAYEAAREINAHVSIPRFTQDELDKNLTDFNDLHKSRGLDAVSKNIAMSRYDFAVDVKFHIGKSTLLDDNGLSNREIYDQQKDGAYISELRSEPDGTVLVPGYDKDGQLQSIQSIKPDGTSRFAGGLPEAGLMHILAPQEVEIKYSAGGGGPLLPHQKVIDNPVGHTYISSLETAHPKALKDIHNPKEILLATDYSSAASLRLATGLPVVAAFSAENLQAVAKSVREAFPEAQITICADQNLDKAQEAALAVKANVINPALTNEDKAQGITTFNDLRQICGLEAVTKSFHQEKSVGFEKESGQEAAPKKGSFISRLASKAKGAGLGI